MPAWVYWGCCWKPQPELLLRADFRRQLSFEENSCLLLSGMHMIIIIMHVYSFTFFCRCRVNYSALEGLTVTSLCGPVKIFTLRGFILRNSSGLNVLRKLGYCFWMQSCQSWLVNGFLALHVHFQARHLNWPLVLKMSTTFIVEGQKVVTWLAVTIPHALTGGFTSNVWISMPHHVAKSDFVQTVENTLMWNWNNSLCIICLLINGIIITAILPRLV